MGGTLGDQITDLKVTADGGFVLTGFTYSNDGDIVGNHGMEDAWVVKLNDTGGMQWQRVMGGTQQDRGLSILSTGDGGCLMSGWTRSSDGDLTSNYGGGDAWLIKLDANGSTQWQRQFGGSENDELIDIITTTDGGYLAVGESRSNDGDLTENFGSNDGWVVKLDSNGDILWQVMLGGSGIDYLVAVRQTLDGGYITVGYSSSTGGGNIGAGQHGGFDSWVVKLDATGAIEWQRLLGGSEDDYGAAIEAISTGGYILGGGTGSYDGDVTGYHGNNDAWLVELDNTGAIEWAKPFGGPGVDGAWSIVAMADGGFVFSGFSGQEGGDVSGAHGYYDMWLVRVNGTGALEWQKCMGGTSQEHANAIQSTVDGGSLLAGFTQSDDGDVIEELGSSDGWIVKLSPWVGMEERERFVAMAAPNPSAGLLHITSSLPLHNAQLTLCDLLGREVHHERMDGSLWTVHLGELQPGAYMLTLTSSDGSAALRIIRE
ncbi:MAG: T9SS type A sorting domain-containing protein [Flavobacteriales bacterium]|nr:T9SS type A sorting domain-containing protein [Flavobacteriales bacterium]